jgi:hypothetical protein
MRTDRPDTVYYLTAPNGMPVKQGLYKSLGVVKGIVTRMNNLRTAYNNRPHRPEPIPPMAPIIWKGTISWEKMEEEK